MPGNAWTTNERGNRDGAQHGPPHEQHISVRGFNAQETRDVLKKGRLSTSAYIGQGLILCREESVRQCIFGRWEVSELQGYGRTNKLC